VLEALLRGLTSIAKPSLAGRHYQAELGNEVNNVPVFKRFILYQSLGYFYRLFFFHHLIFT
jgi:hypothetical protein